MQSDIEIAQAAQPQRIDAIAEKAGIDDKYLEMYGKYKAKVDYNLLRENERISTTATSSASMCARSPGSAWST